VVLQGVLLGDMCRLQVQGVERQLQLLMVASLAAVVSSSSSSSWVLQSTYRTSRS
jgi:hypothetical protein